jgi:hypothetical protein
MEVAVRKKFNWRQKKSTLIETTNEKIISTEWHNLLCATKQPKFGEAFNKGR